MFDFLFEPWLKWFINSQNIWQILLFWTDRSIKLSDCSSSLCPNTVQSEYNSAPSTTTSWALLTLHRGGCHMLRFGCSWAHMPPQETSRNSPRAQHSAAPGSSYLQPAVSSTHSSQLLRLNSDFTRQDQRKKKSAGCSFSAAAAAAWWPSFLLGSGTESIPAICLRYVLATSPKQTLKEWRAVRPPINLRHYYHLPLEAHCCPGKTGCSWATHTMHNAERKAKSNTPFPTVWWLAAWAAGTLKQEASVSHSEAHLEEVMGSFSCLIHRHLITNSRTFCRLHDHTYLSCKCKVNSPLSP